MGSGGKRTRVRDGAYPVCSLFSFFCVCVFLFHIYDLPSTVIDFFYPSCLCVWLSPPSCSRPLHYTSPIPMLSIFHSCEFVSFYFIAYVHFSLTFPLLYLVIALFMSSLSSLHHPSSLFFPFSHLRFPVSFYITAYVYIFLTFPLLCLIIALFLSSSSSLHHLFFSPTNSCFFFILLPIFR